MRPDTTDINALYFRHQIALMRAGEASTNRNKHAFRVSAHALAGQIGVLQSHTGAKANVRWSTHMLCDAGITQ